MTIRGALAELVNLQQSLAIEDPIKAKIAKAWPLPPPAGKLSSFPAFVNSTRLLPAQFTGGAGLQRTYIVQMQLFVKDADVDRACHIALAFEEQLIRALGTDNGITLNNSVTNIETVDGDLSLNEWNGQGYPGLDYFLTLHMVEIRDR